MDDNHAAAALLATFEFLCNGELARMKHLDASVEPWMTVDMNELGRQMFGVYSRAVVVDAVQKLETVGLVTINRRGLGKVNQYLFRFERVQVALRKRMVMDENFDPASWNKLCPAEYAPEYAVEYAVESKSILGTLLLNNKNKKNNISGTESSSMILEPTQENAIEETPERTGSYTEDFDVISVDNLPDWINTMFTDMGRPKQILKRKLQAAFVEYVNRVGKEKVVSALGEFFENGGRSLDQFADQNCRGDRSKINRAAKAEMGRPAFGGGSVARSGSQNRQAFPGSFVSEKKPYSSVRPNAPAEALLWNEIVPKKAWEIWNADLDAALKERLSDPDFVRRYEAMLAKCSEMVSKSPEKAAYVTFGWLLKGDNWVRLINGEHDWLLKTEKKKREEVDTSMDSAIALLKSGGVKP